MRNQFKIFGLTVLAGGLLLLGLLPGAPGVASAGQPAQEVTESSASAEAFVPAGAFMMGCANDLFPDGCDRDTHPVHGVYLDAFYIDRTEVTNAQYRACVTAGACLPPFSNASQTRSTYYNSSTYNDYPVIQVDWNRANAYCHWVGKRLPTEAEWEKAARGTDKRAFPWGNEITDNNANYYESHDPFEKIAGAIGDTTPVGFYNGKVYDSYQTVDSPSAYGLYDMAGNVWQWTANIYEGVHYRYLRGGSKADLAYVLRLWTTNSARPDYYSPNVGFRCVRGIKK